MAESDRQKLLARALALPDVSEDDFVGGRTPPADAEPGTLKRINDTGLRTRLLDARIAEGLQSPKGPQKIASIVRIYPDFDAPARNGATPRAKAAATAAPQQRGLPSVEDMERLVARIREIEATVSDELSSQTDERVATLKRALADLEGPELESAYRELGQELERKRALASQVRFETFRRVERDADFAQRVFLRFLAR